MQKTVDRIPVVVYMQDDNLQVFMVRICGHRQTGRQTDRQTDRQTGSF